jgi:hypothetical protein
LVVGGDVKEIKNVGEVQKEYPISNTQYPMSNIQGKMMGQMGLMGRMLKKV